ncbi:MAG: hydantoinase/oxoprolinase family protein [Pseudomonadota bacterium]
MPVLLGVDTGGTYTDAVLLHDEERVIASSKALTTRHDLSVGIGKAIEAVLSQSGILPKDIALASLSTTLATNALVEGQGGRIGLVYVGFKERDLGTHGLAEALCGDPCIVLAGGHSHAGTERAALDETALLAWLESDIEVSAFAVASQFATRNPAHELRAADLIRKVTGKPVSCSHHLSAKLNGPKRALTALLNARLIGMITRLIEKADATLERLGIEAPLMVVRGDGALISAEQAKQRPIETILSGPAASIVGAQWMTNIDHALVSDIGGTTTDVAVLREGRPAIDPNGARVGRWRTMVEAVAMRTTGLGGDSEVHVIDEGLIGGVTLGPRRVMPISLIASEDPDSVHAVLDEQLHSDTPGEYDARFVRLVEGADTGGLSAKDMALLARFNGKAQPVNAVLKTRLEGSALKRLVNRGIVQLAGITPSDACHVLGKLEAWDRDAAEKAIILIGRKRTGSGNQLCPDPKSMAKLIVEQLCQQTVLALLETAFAEEEHDFSTPPDVLSRHVLMQRGLDQHRGLIRLETGLNVPVVGLGASAATYYPEVGTRLGCEMILPEHAGVANAIGAVVGRVTIRRSGTITSPAEGRFRVHLEHGPEDFVDAEAAMARLERVLEADAQRQAEDAGAEDLQIRKERDVKTAEAEAREMFLEAEITVEVTGRPRIAG